MIRLRRPRKAPAALANKGRELTAEMRRRYRADPTAANAFTFSSKVYGHATVKRALIEMQDGKCCFCESPVTHISYGDVEHFRPKKGYRQRQSDPLGRPGYFWLAYDWRNLLLSCQICNQRFKGNLFPLEDEAGRAQSNGLRLAAERPVFVHPVDEDPAAHIGFRQHIPYGITSRGTSTITGLGLDRTELNQVREDHFALVRRLMDVVLNPACPDALRRACRSQLESLWQPDKPWSLMVWCMWHDDPRPDPFPAIQ